MKRRKFLDCRWVPALPPLLRDDRRAGDRAIDAELKWRLTASWPKSLDTLVWRLRDCSPNMCRKRPTANSRSRRLPPARSCPALQALDAVQNGTVEMGHSAQYYYIGKDPTWALFCATPFGLNARQQNAWFYDGDGQKLIDEFGAKFNT